MSTEITRRTIAHHLGPPYRENINVQVFPALKEKNKCWEPIKPIVLKETNPSLQ